MRVRATSDLHFVPENAEYIFEALEALRLDAHQHGGITLLLGDILDQAESVHMASYVQLGKLLANWPGDLIVIAGNHDQYKSEGKTFSALWPLERGSCRVIEVPMVNPALGSFIPYGGDLKFMLKVKAPQVVWCHHGFKGAYMNAMKLDDHGADVPTDDRLYVSGHYHMPQTVGRSVIYTGSPIEHSFSEEGQVKGWLLWEEFSDQLSPERVAFETSAPKHVTMHLNTDTGDLVGPSITKGRDKVRVKATGTRKQVEANASILDKAGLEGVPVLCRPEQSMGRGILSPSAEPREALEGYMRIVHGSDHALPSPDDMMDWAEEHDLWSL